MLEEGPAVLNQYTASAVEKANAVYIGRGSRWGNPFVMGTHGNRDEVIALYEKKIMRDKPFLQRVKEELKGRDLLCYCAPRACHGDILLSIANEE